MSSDYEIKAKQLPPEDGGGYLAGRLTFPAACPMAKRLPRRSQA